VRGRCAASFSSSRRDWVSVIGPASFPRLAVPRHHDEDLAYRVPWVLNLNLAVGGPHSLGPKGHEPEGTAAPVIWREAESRADN